MKNKTILNFVLGIFLICLAFVPLVSSASVTSILYFDGDATAQSETINAGDSFGIDAYGYSVGTENIKTATLYLQSAGGTKVVIYSNSVNSINYKSIDYQILSSITSGLSGSYTLVLELETILGYKATDTLSLVVNSVPTNPNVDTTAPVITILGSNPVTLNAGTFYSDAGATATDNVDGVITSRIVVTNNVNPNVVGVYSVRYRVSDMAGNIASANRVVRVVPAGDVTAPTIVVLSPESARIYNYSNINLTVQTESNAVVQYSVDGGVFSSMAYNVASDNFNSLVNFTDGTHTVSFTATDMAGNVGTEDVTFYVNVSASGNSTFPIITVITPVDGEEYDDSEITFEVRLNKFASVVYNLDNEGNVTMSQSGSLVFTSNELDLDDDDYTVVFYATDLSGNVASQSVDFSIDTSDDDDDDKDKNSINSVTDLYKSKATSTKKPVIDLSDEEALNKLSWFQRLINWIVGLFGGNPIYK